MRTRTLALSSLIACAIFLFAENASAQYYSGGPGGYRRPGAFNTNIGPYIEGGLNLGTGVGGDLVDEVDPGIGLEGTFGIRFNPAFAMDVTLRDSIHISRNDFVNFFNLGASARFFVPTVGRTDVFVRAGVGFYSLADPNSNQAFAVGLGGVLGLGYDLRVGSNGYVGLEGRVHFTQFLDGAGNDATLALGEIVPRIGFFFY